MLNGTHLENINKLFSKFELKNVKILMSTFEKIFQMIF